ncbi:hypothetical protein ACFL6C_06095 [Myxococcota bacterium]
MLDSQRYLEKVNEQVGVEVLAYADAGLAGDVGIFPRAGLLCGVTGGLVFVEDELLTPGEVRIWATSEIQDLRVEEQGLRSSLTFAAGGEVLRFADIEREPLVRIVSAAGLELSPVESRAGFASPTLSDTGIAAPEYNKVPSLMETGVGLMGSSQSDAGIAAPEYNKVPSLIETGVGLMDSSQSDAGIAAPEYNKVPSLIETGVGLMDSSQSDAGIAAPEYNKVPSLIETGVGLMDSSQSDAGIKSPTHDVVPSLVETHGGFGDQAERPSSLVESRLGYGVEDRQASMIETQLPEAEVAAIRLALRERQEEEAQPEVEEATGELQVVDDEDVHEVDEAPRLLFDLEDIQDLDPDETVLVHSGGSSYRVTVERFVKFVEDGFYTADVLFRLARGTEDFVRLGETPLFERLSPRAQKIDPYASVPPASGSPGKAWRYVGLMAGAMVGLTVGAGFWSAAIGGALGYVVGRIVGAIVRAARS